MFEHFEIFFYYVVLEIPLLFYQENILALYTTTYTFKDFFCVVEHSLK